MTLVEYLVRVLVYLLAFTGVTVTMLGIRRAVGFINSARYRRLGVDDSDP